MLYVIFKFLIILLELHDKLYNFQLFSEGSHFCEEDNADGDNIFRSTFGGNRYFYWSFVSDEDPQWKNSSDYHSYSYGKNWRYRVEEDYDCSSESDSDDLESNIASDRLALGLRAHGPLKLEDVKNAWVLPRLVAIFLERNNCQTNGSFFYSFIYIWFSISDIGHVHWNGIQIVTRVLQRYLSPTIV